MRMVFKGRMAAFLSASALLSGGTAQAQTGDVVMMRRTLAPPKLVPAPVPSPTPTAGSSPTPAPAPVERGQWITGAPVSNGPACSANAPATRSVVCRSLDAIRTLDDVSCADDGAKPLTVTTVEDRRSCTYTLATGMPGPWLPSQCTAAATRSTAFSCFRSGDNAAVDVPTFCDNHAAVVSETAAVYSQCEGEWRMQVSACGTDNQTENTPICWKWDETHTSGSGIEEDKCDPTKKPVGYKATCQGIWTSALGSCNSSNLRDVVSTCIDKRTNQVAESPSICSPATRPVATETCSGTWNSVAGTCGNGVQTPTVTCEANGTTVGDTMCNPSTKPATGEQSCGGVWSTVAATCVGGKQTPTVICQVNGTTVGSNHCTPATRPTATQQSCSATCGTLTANLSSNVTLVANDALRTSIATKGEAQIICKDAAAAKGRGICVFNGASSTVYYRVTSTPGTSASSSSSNFATTCS